MEKRELVERRADVDALTTRVARVREVVPPLRTPRQIKRAPARAHVRHLPRSRGLAAAAGHDVEVLSRIKPKPRRLLNRLFG